MKNLIFCVILTIMLTTTASAETITVGDGWHRFDFLTDGTPWLEPSFTKTPIHFEFELERWSFLEVTDLYFTGDNVTVFDHGHLLQTSPEVPATRDWTDDPSFAYGDSRWSHMRIDLPPGTYDITGIVVNSPWCKGAGYVRLVEACPTPVPGALLLLGSGLLGLVGFRRL